jgi:hypothetical protein
MTVNIQDLIFSSVLSGLGNYQSTDYSKAVTAHSLGVGAYTRWDIQVPYTRSDTISLTKVQYTDLEPEWRPNYGVIIYNHPTGYQIQTITYYTDKVLHLDTIIVNQTGGTINVPAFTINARTTFYRAPF